MDPENITLANAFEATSALICRQLPQHVKVGSMPVGAVTPVALPLRDLNGSGQQLKHFFDVIYDHDGAINFDALAPILRDKAWRELPAPFGLKQKTFMSSSCSSCLFFHRQMERTASSSTSMSPRPKSRLHLLQRLSTELPWESYGAQTQNPRILNQHTASAQAKPRATADRFASSMSHVCVDCLDTMSRRVLATPGTTAVS